MTSAGPASAKGFLIRLAAEGIGPIVGGCAGALLAGPVGVFAGGVVGKVAEEAVRYFGPRIAESWLGWFARQPPALRAAAVAEVGNLTPAEARHTAEIALEMIAPDASPADRAVALEYLAAIPSAVRRSLVTDRAKGVLTVPPTMMLTDTRQLLGLLPATIPPYRAGTDLPGTPYRLGEVLGAGGFGTVYKATTPTLQNLAFAIKFCLDPSMLDSLKRERANLDRLLSAQEAGVTGADRVVRLYGYDFDHQTPYLVYEYVPGSDLAAYLGGKGMSPEETLGVVRQVTEALAFAHGRGLVHRDLKPANVLVNGPVIKLTDFGIGSVTAAHAAARSRIGSTTLDQLNAAEQATLFRGAGTALYMSPEQRRGEPPDPRHDLFSLGVMWYQLLVGDVTRELHPGWADELADDHGAPPAQVEAIRACVGVMKKRPADGAHLLGLLREPMAAVPAAAPERAKPALLVDAEPVTAPHPEAKARREQVAQAVTAAQQARNTCWRWGLCLAGLIVGGVATVASVLFTTLELSLPRTDSFGIAHTTFRILLGVLLLFGFPWLYVAYRSGRARLQRQRRSLDELLHLLGALPREMGLPPADFDRRSPIGAIQAGWSLLRELEDQHLSRDANARFYFPGEFNFDFVLELYVDGYCVGAGGKRRGFDLPARLCRGLHYLEVREQKQRWPQTFVIRTGGNSRVKIGKLRGISLEVEVIESRD